MINRCVYVEPGHGYRRCPCEASEHGYCHNHIDKSPQHWKKRVAELEAELARYRQLLRVADCPQQCDNGAVPHQVADNDWDCYQCQFCYERSELLPPEPKQ